MCVSLSGVRRSSPAFSPQFLLAGSASPWAGRTPAGFQAGQSRRCFVFPALRWFPFMSTPGARRRFLLRLVFGVAGTVSHGRYQSPACSPPSSLSADFLEEAVRASSPSLTTGHRPAEGRAQRVRPLVSLEQSLGWGGPSDVTPDSRDLVGWAVEG